MKQEIARESSTANEKISVSRLAFSEIPHQSFLFAEYLRDPASLRKFYPNAVVSLSEVARYAPAALASYRTDRGELCDALSETNVNIAAGKKTSEGIDLLRRADTVAVVTGQQAGLFTGPLYTLYKALSAIRMSEELNKCGVRAVPVFWAATEDHDFDEVASVFNVDSSGNLFKTEYTPYSRTENSPVGSVEIDGDISARIDELFANLTHTEFTDEMRTLLIQSWAEGTRFGTAFLRTLAWILEKFGMIFLDPMDVRLRRLAAPILAEAVRKSDAIAAALVKRGRELKNQGFHEQVFIEDDYFPLFFIDETGRRIALRKVRDSVYRVKNTRRDFTLTELEDMAESEPWRLSPGVMLRPVVQDHLLPTVCYFGGGAEIAYFAQNSEVYRILDRPATPILHRQSFTVVEAKHRRFLEKYDLDLVRLFDGMEANLLKLSKDRLAPGTARLFADAEEKINTEMNTLDQNVSGIDVTLAENLAKRRRKIIYHIVAMRKKTLLASARKDENFNRRIESVFASLLPHGQLQERSLNMFTYLNKYGLNFVDWMYDAIDLEDKQHRIVNL